MKTDRKPWVPVLNYAIWLVLILLFIWKKMYVASASLLYLVVVAASRTWLSSKDSSSRRTAEILLLAAGVILIVIAFVFPDWYPHAAWINALISASAMVFVILNSRIRR